ncbi:MAG: peroxiredoxin family protein [Promethearchaeota archaeon]
MKLPKELKKKQKQTQEKKTKKSTRKKRKQYIAKPKETQYAVRPKKKFTETFAPYAIIIAVVFVVIIVVVATTSDNSNTSTDNSNSYQTDITFKTINGGTIKLADHQGEIVLLFFFDLDCPPCSPESEIISNIDDDYSNSQLYIVLITVHSYDSNDGLNLFKNDHNLNSPIVRDDSFNSYSAPFNIAYTPTTILLDRDGAEVQRFIGYDANHYNQIKNAINSL